MTYVRDALGANCDASGAGTVPSVETVSVLGMIPRTIIAAVGGDPWTSAASRAVDGLAARHRCEVVHLPVPTPASAIARAAEQYQAAIVVIPSPSVGTPERTAAAALAGAIAATTRHPVLLVPPAAVWLPRVCVAGINFGRASIAAATIAGGVLQAPGREVFATANTVPDQGVAREVESVPGRLGLLLEAIPRTIPLRAGIARTFEWWKGPPLAALLECVAAHRADLLAIGLDGASGSPWRRVTPPGPTVRGVLVAAPCAVLVAGGQ